MLILLKALASAIVLMMVLSVVIALLSLPPAGVIDCGLLLILLTFKFFGCYGGFEQ